MNANSIQAGRAGLDPARLARIKPWMTALRTDEKLTGCLTLVHRRGETALLHCDGLADREAGLPVSEDTIFRVYSMTKPLTSVAIMMLYEEGRFQLDDPVSRFLPDFTGQRVAIGGFRGKIETVPAERDITFRDLLTHTSGLTYGFMEATLVDASYREAKIDFGAPDADEAAMVRRLASMPLVAQPGKAWNYSVSTDVLGHLVSVISGEPFDQFLRKRIIAPLGMHDTDFHVPQAKVPRFAASYYRGADGKPALAETAAKSRYYAPPLICSGGGGLVSTAGDYLRFCQMMLNKGSLGGVRYLGRKTVELMMSNHLAGDMAAMGQPHFSEQSYHGIGFGLGFSVMLDPAKAQILGTPGECAWGGAASTAFWIDPAEEMIVIFMTQLLPSSAWPIRRELRVLAYQAIGA